jgi:two-component SAPR family response regulator
MSAIARQPQHAAPLFRAHLLGSFTLHWRVACGMAEPAVYTEVSPAQWGKRRQAMRLLAVLLARPGRRAGKDFLLELFWPDTEPEQAAVYLTQTVAKLRKVLRLVEGGESLLIVERAGYRLEAQEQLWMDADAAEALLQQASRQGTDGLPLLQEAVTLLQRGPFLEEAEGSWDDEDGWRISARRARSGWHRCWLNKTAWTRRKPSSSCCWRRTPLMRTCCVP